MLLLLAPAGYIRLTILVMKERDGRIRTADVASHQVRGEEDVVQQAVDNIKRLGHNGKAII